ncbi:hypothetical protein RCL1_000667 [Eukaryota sp. TZLM3-RCL]
MVPNFTQRLAFDKSSCNVDLLYEFFLLLSKFQDILNYFLSLQMSVGVLIAFILVPLSVGLLSAWFVRPKSYYASLIKPRIASPSWTFLPVWLVLYTCIGIAGYLFWDNDRTFNAGLALYGLSLVIIWIYFPILYAAKKLKTALFLIVLNWGIALAVTIIFFTQVPASGWLLIPYMIWLSYAVLLNFAVVRLNKNSSQGQRVGP